MKKNDYKIVILITKSKQKNRLIKIGIWSKIQAQDFLLIKGIKFFKSFTDFCFYSKIKIILHLPYYLYSIQSFYLLIKYCRSILKKFAKNRISIFI